MTPKEKAEELCQRFLPYVDGFHKEHIKYYVKQCALIAVDEILKSNPTIIDCNGNEFNYKFWTEVKQEIEKL
jgi:hypothetical protein